jgi:hypothetical protein
MTRAANNPITVQDYIAGRLSDGDQRAFEDQLLSDASLVQVVEESLRLREGLEILRERNDLVKSGAMRRRIFSPKWVASSVAALALVVLCVDVYLARHSRPVVAATIGELRVGAPLTVAAYYSFASMRAATETPDLALPASGVLELRALTRGLSADLKYRVTLEEVLGTTTSRIGVADHLVPDADGFVAVYADASKLQPGSYSLLVESVVDDKAMGERFSFGLHRTLGSIPQDN